MNTISNCDDVIDSRDVIARIEELEEEIESCTNDDRGELFEELDMLKALQTQAECSPDWIHGESLINEDYFVKYIAELIDDCYEMPEGFKSGDWPFRHMQFDYEAAADEARADYMEVTFDGNTFLIRA